MQKIKLGFAEETESNTKRLSIEVAEDSTVVAIEEGAAPVKAAATKKASPAQSRVFTNEKSPAVFCRETPQKRTMQGKRSFGRYFATSGCVCSGLCSAYPHRFRRLNKRSRSPPHPP